MPGYNIYTQKSKSSQIQKDPIKRSNGGKDSIFKSYKNKEINY